MKSSRRIRWRGPLTETLVLDPIAAAKVRKVLRLAPGDKVAIIDDDGRGHVAEILSVDRESVTARIVGEDAPLAPSSGLTVAIAVIKGKRMDAAVEKLAELGVSSIVPIVSKRAVVSECGREKIERWRRIATSAIIQSGRRAEPVIESPVRLDAFLERGRRICLLDPAAERSIEQADAGIEVLLIGPEGGWDPGEREALREKAEAYSLGPATLRTETAATVATYVLSRIISKR